MRLKYLAGQFGVVFSLCKCFTGQMRPGQHFVVKGQGHGPPPGIQRLAWPQVILLTPPWLQAHDNLTDTL